MPTASFSLDPGSYLAGKLGDINVTGTAGGTGDATEANGEYVQPPDDALGAAMVIVWEATLADTESFSLTANAQDATAAAGTGVADFKATAASGADGLGKQTLSAVTVATSSGGTTERGVTIVRFPDIRAHRGYLRSQVTGDLSASATDTFEYTVVWLFSGLERIPPSSATHTNP